MNPVYADFNTSNVNNILKEDAVLDKHDQCCTLRQIKIMANQKSNNVLILEELGHADWEALHILCTAGAPWQHKA